MKVYLSGLSGMRERMLDGTLPIEQMFILESFFSMQKWMIPLIRRFSSFLLDSGAFTFMSAAKKHGDTDWLSYADKYADFIVENNIELFFELDIDSIKGLPYAEMLRQRIETRVGRQSIPVWHISRGKQYFEALCKDYKYIAFGGILTDGVGTQKIEKYFPWFISTAHANGCKIHGLGYTNTNNLARLHFDSIDSTTWTSGGRFGEIHEFSNGVITKHRSVVGGKNKVYKRPESIHLA